MENLSKVSSQRLYLLIKNYAIALLVIVGTMAASKMLPDFLAPVISLGGAAYLYYRIINGQLRYKSNCPVVDYSIFFGLIAFTFIEIVINLLYSFELVDFPVEIVFLNSPFIPSLLMMPILFVTTLVVYFKRHSMKMCKNCLINNGDALGRGRTGTLVSHESRFQMRNLIYLFGIISILIWAYFLLVYVNINTNARDWYVFTWLIIIGILLDIGYMMGHYYSVYHSLEEQGLLIPIEEHMNIPQRTYVRYYLICGEHMLIKDGLPSKYDTFTDHIDTPVIGTISGKNTTDMDADQYFKRNVGLFPGELRLFYSTEYPDFEGVTMKRYFYFLDGTPEDHEDIAEKLEAQWVPFSQIREVYSKTPRKLCRMFLVDMNRLATIMITQKTYDENGTPKFKIKGYQPSFNLTEVRNNKVDFQSEKWIRIAVYNAGNFSYRVNNWFKKRHQNNKLTSWTLI